MSKINQGIFTLLVCVLVAALAIPAVAVEDLPQLAGQDYRAYKQRAGNYDANEAAAANGERQLIQLGGSLGTAQVSAPCVLKTNQCSDESLHDYWAYVAGSNDPFACGSFERPFTKLLNNSFLPETLKTVYWVVGLSPDSGIGAGEPEITVHITGGSGGVPDTLNTLASVTRPYADWTTDPGVGNLFNANDYFGAVSFDFSSFDIILPALNTTQLFMVLEITNRYEITAAGSGDPANVNTCWVFTDEADEDGLGCDDGEVFSSGVLRNRANYQEQLDSCGEGSLQYVWVYWDDLFGANENWYASYEVCVADPVCETIAYHCYNFESPNDSDMIACFFFPSGVSPRKAPIISFEGFVAGNACTLKTVQAFICDWTTTVYDDSTGEVTDPGTAVDIDCVIFDGLEGTEIARVTVPGATVEANWLAGVVTEFDFSSLDITVPPGQRYYAMVEAQGAALGDPGFTLLLDAGELSPSCGAPASPDYMLYVADTVGGAGDTSWVSNVDGICCDLAWVINVSLCCAPSSFLECVPAADADWATQGNDFTRTNASTASISNLCALQTAWSAEPGGNIMAIQPIIAGDYVLVTATDSLHCYLKADGSKVWSFGGFPYIVGDVRGAPTVVDSLVYVGGAGAQAFSCVRLADGTKKWSRNLGGGGDVALAPGQTNWTPSVVAGGVVYFTQETGILYALDEFTGVSVVDSLVLPDAPDAVPYNALTSDGVKLWVGTGDALGTDGNIHQVDAATLVIDWTLNGPGNIFYPGGVGDPDFDPFSPEGFPGSMALENGILYYHSHIRNDDNGFLHFPGTGAVGAIDVATEDGTGAGILWVNDANNTTVAAPGSTPSGTFNYSGPAVGIQMIYLASRGFFGGTTEQDGVSAWDKILGVRLWYAGYSSLGVSGGVGVLDDPRLDAPATVICQPDGVPYVFTGHVGGTWRLYNGNTGELQWYRTLSDRVRGTAVGDDCVATVVRTGGPVDGGGALVVYTVQQDRPRLQIDSQFVFRTATPGDGVASDDVVGAYQNSGCLDLNVAYGAVAPPDPIRVTNVNPNLASATERATRNLGGYDAMLDAYSAKSRAIMISAGVEDDVEDNSNIRTFASNLGNTADPLFVTAVTGPAVVAPGAAATINVTYDETGLTNNTGYTNFIELDTDDPDYYPQDPTGATLGLPSIQFELFIGCPDAQDFMNLGNAGDYSWITNFGAEGGGGNFSAAQHEGIVVNGNEANHFDGGWAFVVTDSVHWAFDGCSSGGYPRRAGEWGPTLPCGLTINALQAPNPLGGLDDYEEVSYNMIDLASTNGFFAPSSRQCGGWLFNVQRVSSQDPEFGMFLLTKFTLTNEAGDFGDDFTGDMNDIYFGGVTDWDISSNDVLTAYADGYAQEDGGAGGSGNGTWLTGHVRLDGDIVGAGPLGSGGAPTFMSSDIQDDQGRGNRAFDMLSDPANYGASVDPASTFNTDLAALMSLAYYPTVADGASETFYFGIYMVENGEQATWSDAAGADAAYADVACRMKGFAGFGKGDVNCDGAVDLADVVALGNILDGIITPAGGGIYTADVDGDNGYDQDDYDLLYDVVAGVQPASAMANAWRF